MGAGRDTLAGEQAGRRTGHSEHILPLIASSFSVTQYMRLPIHCDEEIGHLKTLDAKDTDIWDNKREPNREAVFWAAWGAQSRLETRNLQGTKPRHPSIQANTGLLWSTKNFLPFDK